MRRLGKFAAAVALLAIAPLPSSAGETAPDYFDAVEAYDEGNYSRAYKILTLLAPKGNPDVLNRLGEMLRDGLGATKSNANVTRAAALFSKAATQGHFAAATNFAEIGLGFETRPEYRLIAVLLIRRVAEWGYGPAQVLLGTALLHGQGVRRDPVAAAYWLGRAATQGHRTAPALLGLLKAGGGHSESDPLMDILVVLPTSNLAYGAVEGDRDADGICAKVRKFAETDIDADLLDRLFDLGHARVSERGEDAPFPQWGEARKREAQTRQAFQQELHGLRWTRAESRRGIRRHFYDLLHAHHNYYRFAETDAVETGSAKITMSDPPTELSFRGMKISVFPRGDMNTVQATYREAAMAGFGQAQIAMAVLNWCGQASGYWLSDILAYAWLHVADAQGFVPARQLKTELRKSLATGQIALGHLAARDFRARVEETRWGTDDDRS